MKTLKYICFFSALVAMIYGCKKKDNSDLSFIENAPAPAKLGMLFDIIQDNSGKVSILPTGQGVSSYEIVFGDTSTVPAKVGPGNSTSHIYAEGDYNVTLRAYGPSGKSTEFVKPLTVAFRAPEALELTTSMDPENNFKILVTAKALYETSFKLYFGEDSTETPVTFNEGDTAKYTYKKIGSYKLKLIAQSGGVAITQIIKNVLIEDPILLPLNFESPTLKYTFTNFDGGAVTVIDNPNSIGINTSAKVGQMVKNAGQTWGGSFINLSKPINFSNSKIFGMKVYSPRIGAKVLLKVENSANSSENYEKEVSSTVANGWEDLIFDYSAVDVTKSFNRIVIIFDNGTMGNGSPNFTFLFDDIRLVQPTAPQLPLNFESAITNYTFTGFDGGVVTTENNANSGGINTSAKVGKMVKGTGQTWGGSFIALASPINFTSTKTFKMKVYSPKIGAKVLLKVENLSDGNISYEKEVVTTTANAWEQLTFDYSGITVSNSYQKIVLIFENGTMGDGSSNFTYYFDDIELN